LTQHFILSILISEIKIVMKVSKYLVFEVENHGA
jgi:hypothetical protein